MHYASKLFCSLGITIGVVTSLWGVFLQQFYFLNRDAEKSFVMFQSFPRTEFFFPCGCCFIRCIQSVLEGPILVGMVEVLNLEITSDFARALSWNCRSRHDLFLKCYARSNSSSSLLFAYFIPNRRPYHLNTCCVCWWRKEVVAQLMANISLT